MTTWPETAPKLPFFSPSRPTLGDRPTLIYPDGRSLNTGIPSLTITPDPDGTFRLWGFFPTGGSRSSPKFVTFQTLEDVFRAFERWLACPEVFAVEELNWEPPNNTARTVSTFTPRELTLDDIE